MAILVKMWTFPEGKQCNTYIMKELKFTDTYEFKFDYFNPEKWRKFLANYRTINGKHLPRKLENGVDVCYHVYRFGKNGYYNHFPGNDEEGKGRKIKFFGRIDKTFDECMSDYNIHLMEEESKNANKVRRGKYKK